MKHKGHTLSVTMMITSLVLLAGLQALWLHNSYEKAYLDFRKEAGSLFRNAVFAVRDSMLFEEIEAVPPDSGSWKEGNIVFATRTDSTVLRRGKVDNVTEVRRGTAPQIQIFMTSRTRPDSIRTILRPFATRITEESSGGVSRFLLRMNHDSLNTDSIGAHFARLASNSRYAVPFEVTRRRSLPPFAERANLAPKFDELMDLSESTPPEPVLWISDEMRSDWVRVDPLTRYAVVLHDFRPALLREILPQILFSAFLTLVTSLSFFFMYRSIRSQERLMNLKNDFISNITHELKTPIATVSVALEALRNFGGKDNPKTAHEYLDIARYELDRLAQLTDKVLTTSLFDEHGMKLDFHPANLEEITRQVIGSLALLSEKHRSPISLTLAGDDFTLSGNAFHLSHVLHNILDNALKYAAGSGPVEVTLRDLGDEVQWEITDHGPGIPQEFQSKVFDKFFRVPSGDVHNTKGYGLGLSYVKTVVTQHGGRVELKSKPGETSFSISIPKKH